jgi:hypothetical protein
MSNPKAGETWYIANEETGECEVVEINDVTKGTVELIRVVNGEKVKKRYATTFDYISFVEQVGPAKVVH